MPQMNKGEKFIFGEAEIHSDGRVRLQELHPYIQRRYERSDLITHTKI